MTPESARARIAAARVAVLGTTGPHLVPVCFAVDPSADVVWSAVDDVKPKTTRALRRLDNIARDPTVSLLVHDYSEDWSALWWARADGTASVLPSSDRALSLLCARYPQYADAPPPGPFLQIAVARWSGWAATPG